MFNYLQRVIDFNLCRFLGNALAIGSLLSNQDYHMVNSIFNESCCVLLNYLCSLSEECFDERVLLFQCVHNSSLP